MILQGHSKTRIQNNQNPYTTTTTTTTTSKPNRYIIRWTPTKTNVRPNSGKNLNLNNTSNRDEHLTTYFEEPTTIRNLRPYIAKWTPIKNFTKPNPDTNKQSNKTKIPNLFQQLPSMRPTIDNPSTTPVIIIKIF